MICSIVLENTVPSSLPINFFDGPLTYGIVILSVVFFSPKSDLKYPLTAHTTVLVG